MNAAKTFRNALLALGCLSASSALAIPSIQACQSYKSWSSGLISYNQIATEWPNWPVSVQTAKSAATSRCYNLWMNRGGNNLTYANAGNIVQAWQSATNPGYYEYQCLICSNATAPRIRVIDIGQAVEHVRGVVRGEVIAVQPVKQPGADGDAVQSGFEVSVMVGDHLTQVSVDGESGELRLPEVTSQVVIYTDNVCR